MSAVYRAGNPIDAQLVADELRGHGIGCTVTGGYLAGAIGELPPGDVLAVRLHDARDESRARAVIGAFEAARRDPRPDWTCDGCDERVGGEFGACWNCGAPAPESSDEPPAGASRPGEPSNDEPMPDGPAPDGTGPASSGTVTKAF